MKATVHTAKTGSMASDQTEARRPWACVAWRDGVCVGTVITHLL